MYNHIQDEQACSILIVFKGLVLGRASIDQWKNLIIHWQFFCLSLIPFLNRTSIQTLMDPNHVGQNTTWPQSFITAWTLYQYSIFYTASEWVKLLLLQNSSMRSLRCNLKRKGINIGRAEVTVWGVVFLKTTVWCHSYLKHLTTVLRTKCKTTPPDTQTPEITSRSLVLGPMSSHHAVSGVWDLTW